MAVVESTASWNYGTATFRQTNGNAADQLDFLQTLAGNLPTLRALSVFSSTGIGSNPATGIDIDSLNTSSLVNNIGSGFYTSNANSLISTTADYIGGPIALGRHIAIWKEWVAVSGTGTFYGTAGATTLQSGIFGSICN
jgi:hypothetical protein